MEPLTFITLTDAARWARSTLTRIDRGAIDGDTVAIESFAVSIANDPQYSRYVIGGAVPALVILATDARDRATDARIEQWAFHARDWLRNTVGAHIDTIGAWKDAHGHIHFDFGTLDGIRRDALSTADLRGERAIWDRVTETELEVN